MSPSMQSLLMMMMITSRGPGPYCLLVLIQSLLSLRVALWRCRLQHNILRIETDCGQLCRHSTRSLSFSVPWYTCCTPRPFLRPWQLMRPLHEPEIISL